MSERLSFSAVWKGQQTIHWTFGLLSFDWAIRPQADLLVEKQQGTILDWAIDQCMQSIRLNKEDKFYPEKERWYWDSDRDEIQQHGCSKGWAFRNDKKKADESNY